MPERRRRKVMSGGWDRVGGTKKEESRLQTDLPTLLCVFPATNYPGLRVRSSRSGQDITLYAGGGCSSFSLPLFPSPPPPPRLRCVASS